MICGSCGTTTATSPCAACGADALLDGRYRLDAVLGQGGAGVTYRATRVGDGRAVCVKELTFHRLQSFEAERLFRREAGVLRQLHHPQIPAYLDDFTAGAGKQLALYLVQELVVGQSLTAELAGHRYTEREVLALLDELLGVLAYLHGLAPPVIHRDLKPSNILRRASDGRLVLVDFGSVKDTAANSISGGPTVAGTFGYMAPEQLYGQASPASDLYATGVLGVVLLSRRDPADLVDHEHTLAWRPHVRASAPTVALLDRLTRRDPTQRPQDAAAARALMRATLAALAADPAAERAASRPPPAPESAPRVSTPQAIPVREEAISWRPFVAVLLMMLATLAIIALVLMPSAAPIAAPSTNRPLAAPNTCSGHRCLAPSEPVFGGLRFGMTLEEVQAARLDPTTSRTRHVTNAESVADIAGLPGAATAAAVPRDVHDVTVRLGGSAAQCSLGVHPEAGLTVIRCDVIGSAGPNADRAFTRLEAWVTTRYGRPTSGGDTSAATDRDTRWAGGGATIIVSPHLGGNLSARSGASLVQLVDAWATPAARARAAGAASATTTAEP